MKIYAPNKNANGVYASVRFVDGIGETDDPVLIEWFRARGYTLAGNYTTTPIKKPVEEVKVEEKKELCFEDMTPSELREWMMANGFSVGSTRSKAKLLDILKG